MLDLLQAKAYLLFPLLAAALYAVASIAIKASSNLGIGGRRTVVVCNWAMAVAFAVFYDWSTFPQLADPWWPMVVLGVLCAAGQICTVLAFSHGEVSSVGPVLGVKVVLVAFVVAIIFQGSIAPLTWAAAVLSAIGIVCLQITDRPHDVKRSLGAMGLAFCAASSFAAFDAMTQHYSPKVGFGYLVPPAVLIAACLTSTLLFKPDSRKRPLTRRTAMYLLVGAGFFALQSAILTRSIGAYGDAAGANVAFGSRGLWGLLFVWLIGHWFANDEFVARHRAIVVLRILGAILMMAAIVLVFV